MLYLLLWRVHSIINRWGACIFFKYLINYSQQVTNMEEEEAPNEIKELNADAIDEALGDVILIEEEEEYYFSVSPDDDLDIAFTDEDTRDWI